MPGGGCIWVQADLLFLISSLKQWIHSTFIEHLQVSALCQALTWLLGIQPHTEKTKPLTSFSFRALSF